MELVAVTLNWKELNALVPEEYIDKYSIRASDINKVVCLCLEENGSTRATMVLFPYNDSKAVYSIIYVAVDAEYEGKGIAKKLLVDSFELMKKQGIKQIVCASFEDDEPFVSHLLESVDFVPKENSCLMVYGLDYKKGSEIDTALKKMSPLVTHVSSLYSLDKKELTTFVKEMQRIRPLFNIGNIDKEYSVVYRVDKKIIGFMGVEKKDKNFVKTNELYIKKSDESKYAIPGMIAFLMRYIKANIGPNVSLVLDMPKSSIGHGIIKIFGEPDEIEEMVVLNLDL